MKRHLLLTTILFLCALSSAAFGQYVNKVALKSEVLGEDRVALVRTPAGYETNDRRYPVLYMTDGEAQLAHTASTVDFLARNGRMPELIIVAIVNTDRTRDLTPTKSGFPNPDGKVNPLPTSGGADKFLKFIETELIPKIESSHRTQPYRIFAGHSFGGLFALHAFLTRPEVFNSVIAVSPTMEWDDHLLSRRAEEFFKGRQELNKTLYLTLANERGETRADYERFKTILAKNHPKNFEWGAMLMEDEDHGSVVLRSHYDGFRKIFADWRAPTDLATGAIKGRLPEIESHYKALSKRFGYTILPPELLINQLGYQLIGEGRLAEAIDIFKTNVERYPNSANVYDSLAEAYEKSGKLDLARPNYEKAVKVGEQTNDPNLNVFKTNFERVDGLVKKNVAGKEK